MYTHIDPPPPMDNFVSGLLRAIKAKNSAVSLRVIGEVLAANNANLYLTHAVLLEVLRREAETWFSEAKATAKFGFMIDVSAALANLSVDTRNDAEIERTRQLFREWTKKLVHTNHPGAKSFVQKLQYQEERILDERSSKWFLVPE